jgi:hypothetical protein
VERYAFDAPFASVYGGWLLHHCAFFSLLLLCLPLTPACQAQLLRSLKAFEEGKLHLRHPH